MRRPAFLALWTLATAALAGVTAYLVVMTMPGPGPEARESSADFHEWMHARLHITPAQEKALAPLEHEFTVERERLQQEIHDAGHQLAQAVHHGERDSPEIHAALDRLNAARAELQRLTLDHFFVMKEELDPEQAEKLLEWTHERLIPE